MNTFLKIAIGFVSGIICTILGLYIIGMMQNSEELQLREEVRISALKSLKNCLDNTEESEITEGLDIKEDDIEKIINVASIIEKEARVDEDRPLIASVIYNRLEQDMPLQIDATVIYAHGYYIENVRNRHLAIESKYNTYLHKGLPVGPICNPGAPSIKAALNPANTNYLFYLLASDDEHYFTDNYDDFLKKKEELGY